jgi:hypothetical protein
MSRRALASPAGRTSQRRAACRHADTGRIGEKHLHDLTTPADEHEQRAPPRLVPHLLAYNDREPLDPITHIDDTDRDEDLHACGDHRALPRARTTSASSAASKPDVTRTRAPPTATTTSAAAADDMRVTTGTIRTRSSRPIWLDHHRSVDAA